MADTAIPGAAGGTLSTALHLAVSASSLGVLALLALWGWETVGRDVEDVPVLRAAQGAMRVGPPLVDAPLQVVSMPEVASVAAGAGVTEPPQVVRLAPEGADLAADDLVRVPVETPPTFRPAAEAAAPIVTIALEVPGVGVSPRPIPRGAASPAAEAPAAGTALAQVGSFRTAAAAHTDWARLARRHGDLFEARQPIVVPTSVDGQDLFLLRAAGFDGAGDAAVFCAALSAAGTECLPATQR